MGSDISQSQQLRNTFPLSEYMMLPSDKNYPDLTFIQRLCDNAIFAAYAIDKSKQNYQKTHDKHVIKRVQRRQIGKKIFQLYQWATANVQGLVQYINLNDKNRKISKTQYKAIVQGSIRGYNAISKQSFQIQCVQVNMANLRIFNEVQLKVSDNNSKQIVNSIVVKVLPKNLNQLLKPQTSLMKWKNVGQCIHQGGILTQRQLLGQYLLQLSNYSTKNEAKNKNQSLRNLKNSFGTKMHKVVEALLSNEEWKSVVRIFNEQQKQQTLSNHRDKSPLKQISNIRKVDATTLTSISQKYVVKEKASQTQKTIDTVNKNTSQKILFKCFKPQEQKEQRTNNFRTTPIKEREENKRIQMKNDPQLQLRSQMSSNYQFRSLSPNRQTKYYSPASLKVIQEVIPPQITKVPEDLLAFDNTKLTRTNSILTIFPDILRQQNEMQQRNRILSARNLRPQQYFSPDQKNTSSKMIINSPKNTKNNQMNYPYMKNNQNNEHHHYENKKQTQNPHKNIQKRKGKKIQFKPSKVNNHLKPVVIVDYVVKIKPDMIQNNKKQQNQQKDLVGKNDSFLSQEFSGLNFSLQQKYFGYSDHKFTNQTKANEKANNNIKPKIDLKSSHLNQSNLHNNNNVINQNIKSNANNSINNHVQPSHNNKRNPNIDINSNPNNQSNGYNIHNNPNQYIYSSPQTNKLGSPSNPKIFHQNSPYVKLDVKQANSQTILIEPQKSYYIYPNANTNAPNQHNQHNQTNQNNQINQANHHNQTNQAGNHNNYQNYMNHPIQPNYQNQPNYQQYQTMGNNQCKPQHKPEIKNQQILHYKDQIIQHSKPQIKNQPQKNQQKLKQSKYVGPINMKGQKQGQGKLYFPSGGSYIGNFFKDFMHGNGKLYYPSGKIAYEGNFKYDKFHGFGKLYNQNPTYIQAFDFRNFNKLQVTQKQQPIHKQHFLINPIQKQKKLSYWKYYEGDMNYDMKHGKGTLVLQNGQKFQGQFRDDLVNGNGIFYGQNGKISGKWQDNLLVQIYR